MLHDICLGAELRKVSNPMRRIVSRTVYGLKMMDVDVPYVIKKQEARAPSASLGGRATRVRRHNADGLLPASPAAADADARGNVDGRHRNAL